VERGEPHRQPGPVFVGGTGRCGTHVVASLAARSGRYGLVPSELRLHFSPEGLPGFAHGSRSRRRLLRGLRTHWWRHSPEWDTSEVRGTHRIATRFRYFTAVVRLAAARPGADRVALSRRFVSSLLDPLAPTPGAWVEKSPDNCAGAGFLGELFPELRLIHVIRDGRDVACSFMRVPWAPDDFAGALAVWERRMLDAHRGTLKLRADSVHRVMLEDLVWRDRDRGYRALLSFLGIPDAPRLRAFFDREVTGARARIGRWRSDLPPSEHALAESLYGNSLERLEAAGVGPLPPLDGLAGCAAEPDAIKRHSPSPIDPWAAKTTRAAGDPQPLVSRLSPP
jgi:Sulfotransferase family